jgi:hypothetical protein
MDLQVLETGGVGDAAYALVKVKSLLAARFYMQVNSGSLQHHCWRKRKDEVLDIMRKMTA